MKKKTHHRIGGPTTASNAYERFMALTPAQRDAEVAEYDKEWTGPGLPGKALTAADKALHRRAAAKAGRPRVGKGAKIVPVSIERDLLRRADRFAKRHKLKRSQMVARGLRMVMGSGLAKAS